MALSHGVGPELVNDCAFGRYSLLSQKPRQQPLRRVCVAVSLDDFVENITVLINGAPQPMFLVIDRNGDLVQTPNIVTAWRHPL
jgi:hypothetical protein